MEGKQKRILNLIKKFENLEGKREDFFIHIIHDQVSYIFGDCTIKFTSPYRLACSLTGEKPKHLHVHKTTHVSLAACSYNSVTVTSHLI